jgi:SIR2-like domain
VLLLGAGASQDAGLPTSRALTERVLETFKGADQYQKLLRYVVGGLQFQRAILGDNPLTTTVDIEAVVQAVRLLGSREQSELAPFVGSWHTRLAELTQGYNPLEVVSREILNTLAAILWNVPASKTTYLHPLRPLIERQRVLDIVTLNFDNVVETFAADQGIPLSTGLGHGNTGYDTKRGYELTFGDTGINLYKLHGSLNWILHDAPSASAWNDLIPHSFVLAHPTPFTGQFSGGHHAALIGPNKLTTDGPYLQLLQRAEHALRGASILTVVGYSFRDEHVNDQIVRFMNRDPANTLRVVDPSPLETAGFLGIVLQACSKRVSLVKQTAQDAFAMIFERNAGESEGLD